MCSTYLLQSCEFIEIGGTAGLGADIVSSERDVMFAYPQMML
jgi:hypothetical protein